jgi:AraC-like DNA-binding protein
MPRKRYPVTAAEIEDAVNSLSPEEQANWREAVRAWLINCVILTPEETDTLLRRKVELLSPDYLTFESGVDPWQWVINLEFQLKARNRRSDPETVRRNVEICDRRKLDKKTWTLGTLSQHYGISRQYVARIIKEEERWRRLAKQL